MDVRAQTAGTTLVRITEAGFTGDGDELANQVTGSTQGFSLVLAGVADRYPKGIEEHAADNG